MEHQITLQENQNSTINPNDNRLLWFKYFLTNYFEDEDGMAFDRMINRNDGIVKQIILNFCNIPVREVQDREKVYLVFYKTEYEKTFYQQISIMKKVARPLLPPASPRPESPPSPNRKIKGKTVTKNLKKKKKDEEGEVSDHDGDFKNIKETENDKDVNITSDLEKNKRKRSVENKTRPQSPTTVIELGPESEVEHVYLRVMTLVKKKKNITQLHCCPMLKLKNKLESVANSFLCIFRKTAKCIPYFDTYDEMMSEFSKYIVIGTIKGQDYISNYQKYCKVFMKHIETNFREPNVKKEESRENSEDYYENYHRFNEFSLPYDVIHFGTRDFFHAYCKNERQLYDEFKRPKTYPSSLKHKVMSGTVSFTLRNILFSPLYALPDDLAGLFYKIRLMKEIKSIEINELEVKPAQISSLKDNLRNHLQELSNKMNWCRNHLESDLDIEIFPWLEAEELRKLRKDEILEKKEIIDKINKKIEIWGRYISTILMRTSGKKPKGSGPYGEYEFWSKREGHLGPLLLTFYGKSVSRLLHVLKKIQSPQVDKFIAKRLLLKKYYETSKINKKYIWVCMCILDKINKATNTDEIKLVISEFWKNLRYLWLSSSYWAVKTNIIRFIERVQYLIVKKCIRVLEVNNFFMIPQVIARQLAIDVIKVMQNWKNSFYEVKAQIEMHQCEMRWEFPLHRIFNVTDYMAKLSADFCFLAESLNHYLEIFSNDFAKVVQDEVVIDTFVQRVKLLTLPLKTADFNIYDPENDVHWNLLMETFVRDLNSIQKESTQIINQSFKNLRSSVIAADLLVKLKEIDKKDKCYVLLMSKFEFIILQILKEIKGVSEFIMNEISYFSSYSFFLSKHSGMICFIRQLTLFMQFRFVYLSHIKEIRVAQTYQRALASFETFSNFYDMCQLIFYLDWLNVEKINISCQLMKKVFKTKSVNYDVFRGESNKSQISSLNMLNTEVESNKEKDHFNLHKQKLSDKPVDCNDSRNIKFIDQFKNSKQDDKVIFSYNEIYSNPMAEDEKYILNESQKQLLLLMYEEKRYLNNFKLMNCDKEGIVEGDTTWCDSLKTKRDILNQFSYYKLLSFSNLVASYLQPLNYNTIIERISVASQNIFFLSYLKKSRLLVTGNIETSTESSLPYECQMDVEKQELNELSKSKENSSDVYQISDDMPWPGLMFKTCTECSRKFRHHYGSNKEDDFFPALNQIKDEKREEQMNPWLGEGSYWTISNIFQNKNWTKNTIKQSWKLFCPEKIDNKETICQENIGDSSMKNQMQTKIYDVLLHDMNSLLIERGLLIEVNFDFHLCDLVLEIYHFAKLGFKLPGKFYGLALMKNIVLKDLRHLNSVSAKYNSLIFSLQQEELLFLKIFIHDFEHWLTKGVKYYSWYTIKAENFCDILSMKLSFLYSLKENTQNIVFCIRNVLHKIKAIDWFDFPDPEDEINFKSMKERLTKVKFHSLYKTLKFEAAQLSYFNNISNLHMLSTIMKMRTEVLSLNRKPWSLDSSAICSLCNFRELKDVFHFLADFFEELEARRKNAYNQMVSFFAMITPFFMKMEYLILKQSTGKNQYLQLFYKIFGEKIIETLVMNLLQNIKKFKFFLLGKEFNKFQLIITTIPDIIFDYHIDQCSFFLKNAIDQLLLRYRTIPRWQVGSCLNVKHISSGNKSCKNNYLEEIMKFKIVTTELIEIQQLIYLITIKCSEYLAIWQQLKNVWVFDKETSTETFLEQARDLVNYCDVSFFYYDHFINDLKKRNDYIDLYCVRIRLQLAKREILFQALEWKYIVKSKLTSMARSLLLKIHQRLMLIYSILTQFVQNLEEFQDILQVVNEIVNFSCDYDNYISLISNIRYILARHGLKLSVKDHKLLNEVIYLQSVVIKLAKYRSIVITPSKRLYAKMSQELISNFASNCHKFAEVYFKEGPGTVGDDLVLGRVLMEKFKLDFEIYNSQKETMIQAEQLFEHCPASYDFYEEAFQQFLSLEIAFKLYDAHKESRDDWATIFWVYLDSKKLDDGIDEFLSQYRKLPNSTRNLPLAKEIKKYMSNFKCSVAIMVQLKNEALKERHWKEIMLKTGHFFDMSPSKFTLNDLFLMNLHLNHEIVHDIVGKAMRELNIETSFDSVKKFWKLKKFVFSFLDNQYFLKDIEILKQKLEDYCIDLQKMSDSHFATPFLEEINSWIEKFATVQEVLTHLILLQNNLLDVRNVFDDPLIQKKFPDAYKQFCLINKQFGKIIKEIKAKPTVIDHCLSPGRLHETNILLKNIEKCTSSLVDYVRSGKKQFPRFYLLSDKELLPLLNGALIENIRVVLPKIFHNVSVSFIEVNLNEKYVTGMISMEGEMIPFKNQIKMIKSIPIWMSSVVQEMKKTIKFIIKMSIYNYAFITQSCSDWISKHAGVCTLAASKVWWTAEVEYSLMQVNKGNVKAMKSLIDKLNFRLDELLFEIRSPLSNTNRIKFINIFLLIFHGKSVVEKLINESVMSKNDFDWNSQLRFYWVKIPGTLKIKQCIGEFEYGYEYMGLTNNLVITPLTERVFLGLTQALQHYFSAAIAGIRHNYFSMYEEQQIGPTSSGKSATVRDLSKIFGTLCIFTSCSRMINKQYFNNIFATLCNEGLWGCFDDFIEIDISVISMVMIELNAIRFASLSKAKSLHIDGLEINFESSTQIIITLNKDCNAKSKELPQTIKLLFRPVSCMLPNIEEICYASLLSEGFYNAKVLSKKITSLYKMANNILFHSHHYDFSLRSLKSLLVKCGDFRRSAPDIEEDAVIVRALRDTNLSKLFTEDNELLLKLMKDLFPSTESPDVIDPKFEQAIRSVWKSKGYIFVPKMIDKIFQTYEIIKTRQFVALVGHTGGGKTFIVNTICSAQSLIGSHSTVIRIIPKSYSIVELFGSYDDLTTKWSDGLFTRIFKEFNKSPEKHSSNYILFDGEIEESWFQCINSLMDDDKLLMLTCERIPLTNNCYILFEVGSLQSTSPGFISRIGVVYVDFRLLEYHPYWEHWVESRIDGKEKELLNKCFEKYVPSCLSLFFEGGNNCNAMTSLKTIIPQTSLNMVVQLCFILDCLIPVIEDFNYSENLNQHSNQFMEYELESIFVQAIYLSIGECLSQKDKEIFDEFMKRQINFPKINDSKEKNALYGTIPTKMDTLYDYKLDREMKCWRSWEDCMESYTHDCFYVDEIIVPTKDSSRIIWILNLINEHNVTQISYKSLKYKLKAYKKKRRPVLLVGEPSSTKTTLLKGFSRCLCFNEYDKLHLNCSTINIASKFQVAIEDRLQKHVSYAWRPKHGKKLIVFIDDLNNPQIVRTSMEQPKAFLKMILEYDGMFTRDGKYIWKILKDIYFFSAMDISYPFDHEDHRFMSLFSIFYIHNPSQEVIKQILTSVLEAHTISFEKNVKEIVPSLVLATIDIYMFTLSNLLPTPSKFHYIFNMNNLSRIIQGILQTSRLIFKRSEQILRVWRNEVTRELWDRLIDKHEQDIVNRKMESTLQEFFPSSTEYVMQDPLLFGDYRNATQPDQPRDYEDLLDYEAVYHLFTEVRMQKYYGLIFSVKKILHYLNRTDSNNEIVLFEVALEHLTRIHRILRLYRGHAMIIGPVGSGKQTVVHLASFTAGCKIVELANNSQNSGFIRNIKKILYSVLLYDQKTTLVVKIHHIKKKGILEIINNLMSRDDSLSIFNTKEKLSLISEIQKLEDVPSDDKNQIWKHLEIKCKTFLHVVLLMTPSMDYLRNKFIKFPGLINHTTIDWMTTWPTEALYAVGRRFLNEAVNVPEHFKKSIIESVVYIHEISRNYLNEAVSISFQAYITPKHYLDFIKLFLYLFETKHFQIIEQNQLFENAIEKVMEAIEDLKVLRSKIDVQNSVLKEKEDICSTILMTMSKVSDELNSMKNSVEKKKNEIKFLNQELTLHMEEIQTTLEKAMEDIYQAIESLKNVNFENIKQISAQENPSEITLIIFECVTILLRKSEVHWNSITDFLCGTDIITSLEGIDFNAISVNQQKQVRGRLKRLAKLIGPSTISEIELKFLHVVETLIAYCNLMRENKPKQERIAFLNAEIDMAQNFLNRSKIKIEQLEIEVKINNEKNEIEKEDKYKAHCELEVSITLLEAAEKLVCGLTSEHKRWKKELNSLKLEMVHIIGNNLISAGFLVYTGLFSYEDRMKLMQHWNDFLESKKIPFSSNFKLETELANSLLLRRWIAAGLSETEFAIQNAILLTYSPRIPLCIDPKEEAVNWIMRMEEVNNCKIISYENTNIYEQFEIAKKAMNSLLIKDADCIDPQVLQTIEKGRGAKPIFYLESREEDFVMASNYYFSTKNIHPHFDPDVYSLTNVINFSMSKMEIQNKLLDFIFEHERKDLWDQRKGTILNKFTKQNMLKNLEDCLILKVGKSEFGLLEHIGFIETLNNMNIQIDEMRVKFSAEVTALTQYNEERNKYEALSKTISILYFILSGMYIINCMYEISIQLFFDILTYLWKNILPQSTENLLEKERIENLIKFMKKFFYDFQSRGTFAHHSLLLSFMMAIEFDKSKGILTQREINFFISSTKVIYKPQESPISWISDKIWQKLNNLSCEFTEDFGDIIGDITSNSEKWQQWFALNQTGRTEFPYPYNEMKLFKKLMLLKCFDINSIYNIIGEYISEALGEEFLTRPLIKIEEVYHQSTCKRPVIFIMTPGADPYVDITHLATKYNIRNKLLMSSLGSIEKGVQRNMLLEAMSKGLWIAYQNCHLDVDFVNEIDKLLNSTTKLNGQFRLWLITEFSNEFPSRAIKSSIKVMTEISDTFKSKMEDTYSKSGQEYLNSFNYPEFKPLLYALTLFHCIVLERKKYGSLGWNKMYEFGNSDYSMAIQTIQEHLNRNIDYDGGSNPWKALKYLIGEIIYGGHMTDKYDRRIILCYLEETFGDFLISSSKPFTFYKDKNFHYNILPDGNTNDYIGEIKKFPTTGIARILGLHPNSDLKYYQDAVKMMWKNLSLYCSSKDTCFYTDKEDVVLKSLNNILKKLPSTLNYEEIRGNRNVPTTPTITVLIHELQRMNILIKKIFKTSKQLIHVITGQMNMNEEMENMFTCIYNNELPITWRLLTPETCKNLPDWTSHLLQRVDEYKKWMILCPILPVIWLSGLYKPKSLFIALTQEASWKTKISLENLIMCSIVTCEYDPDNIQDPSEMGCYVKGLFIEGAGWDTKSNCLKSLKPNTLCEPLPILMFLPMEKYHSKDQVKQNTLKIPIYVTKLRNSSGNGLMFEAEMKSSKHKNLSILSGVCILLNID